MKWHEIKDWPRAPRRANKELLWERVEEGGLSRVCIFTAGYHVKIEGVKFPHSNVRNRIILGYVVSVPPVHRTARRRKELLGRYIPHNTGAVSGANTNPELLKGYEDHLENIIDVILSDSFFRLG